MATTYYGLYLGNFASIDPTEGNTVAENTSSLLGQTFGSAGSPLFTQKVTVSVNNNGGNWTALDQDNNDSNDTFTINGGSAQTFDASVIFYDVTVTYTDGSTGTVDLILFQDTAGNTYMAPPKTTDANSAAYALRPIQSLSIPADGTYANDFAGMGLDREVVAIDDGYIDGTSSSNYIDGSYNEPTASGSDRVDNGDAGLPGTSGDDDHIRAYGGNDSVYSGEGNDVIYGGTGNDRLYGGNDNDTIYGEDGTDWLYGGNGDDLLDAGAGNDRLYGDAGNDTLAGGAGNDSLFGGDGQDRFLLWNGDGDDTISGGEGGIDYDTIDASNGTSGVNVTLTGTESGNISGLATIQFTEIENFVLTNQADTFDGSSATGGLSVDALDGNDAVTGGSGNDTIYGSGGNDTVYGGSGTDQLYAGSGNDSLYGGAGDDTLYGDSGTNVLDGGTGLDRLVAGSGADAMNGGAGQDTADYSLSTGAVTVDLGAGTGSGGWAAGDTYTGVDGIIGSAYGDSLTGYNGQSLTGDAANDYTNIFYGGAGNDTLSGLGGNDSLFGGADHDSILGGDGDDTLSGDAGNDTIIGGDGNDVMSGGDGQDVFVLQDGHGTDTITGGEGGSDLDTIDASALTSGVTVTLSGTEAGSLSSPQGSVAFTQVEGFTLTDQADTFDGSASTGAQSVNAGGGDDTLTGGSGADTLNGGDGADVITGGDGNDQIDGGDGDDQLFVGRGDTATGGDGDDRFVVQSLAGSGPLNIVGGDGGQSAGDTIDFNGLLDDGAITFTTPLDTPGGGAGSATLNDGTVVTFSGIEKIICFAAGTLIDTPQGAVPVQDLRPGDLVTTLDAGARPVRWIGRRSVAATGDFAPWRVAAGAFGNAADLWLSPQHRLLLSGAETELMFGADQVLAAVKHLGHLPGISRVEGGEITYVHILLDDHQIVFADGTAAETLHPGAEAVDAMGAAGLAEALALFPDLGRHLSGSPRSCRRILRSHEAAILRAPLPLSLEDLLQELLAA